MRKSVLFGTVVLISVFWGSLLVASEMCVPMGEITLESLAENAKRSEVAFPHAAHFSYSCQQCHHKWNGREAIQNCTTSGCHDLDKVPEEKAQKVHYYKHAFHTACIGCHKEIKNKNKAMESTAAALGEKLPPTGPTGCNQCHPKE
jgi:hypothetical protein